MKKIHKEAFKLMCGKKLGTGCNRIVYECKLMPEWVIKTERLNPNDFSNVREHHFWNQYKNNKAIAKWLAPCGEMSPDGVVLLQRRVEPLADDYKLPKTLPAFLSDLKRSNFGLLDGKLVCVDYADNDLNPSLEKQEVPFWL